MAIPASAPQPTAMRLGGHTVVLRAGIWLDPLAARELRRVAIAEADGGAREIVLDLSEVVASDARVSAPLSELAIGLIARQCDVALCAAADELRAILDGVPVLRELEIFATVEDALAYLLRLPLSVA